MLLRLINVKLVGSLQLTLGVGVCRGKSVAQQPSGYRFVKDYDPNAAAMKHDAMMSRSDTSWDRSAARVGITLICDVRQGSRPWAQARLEDLSPGGFRIARLPAARMELPLRIRLPGMQMLSAEIRWLRNGAVGCAFAEPLHVAVFEHLVRRAS